MDKQSLRFKVLICNIVISVLCVLSIVSYFFMPFWKVTLSYTIEPEMIEDIMAEAMEGQDGLDFDAGEVVGAEGITLEMGVRFKTADILSSLSGDATESVQKIIDDNVSYIIDKLYPTLSNIASNTAKVTVKATIYSIMEEELEGEEEFKQTLADAGVTEEYINGKVDSLIDTIDAGAHVDEIANQVVDSIDEICIMLGENDSSFGALDADQKAEFTNEIKDILVELADENGNLKTDELIASLVLKVLDGGELELNNNEIAPMSAASSDADEPTSSVEQLKVRLTEIVMEQIPDDTAKTISLVMKIIAGVFIFTAFTWFYIILKILAKLKKTNNAVKLKLPIWLGWLPCLILVFVPSIAFAMLKKPDGLMADMMGASSAKETAEMLSNLSVSFSSASIISFAIAMTLVVFSLAYYGRLRRKLKKIRKAEKKGVSLDA